MPVKAQTEPIKLELTGRTAYNENTLNQIRPRFDTLVEKVLVEKGQHVKKGDPLVDLYSTDLAKAKNEFQTNYVQWQHDLRLFKLRERLVKHRRDLAAALGRHPERREQEPAALHDLA